MSSLDIEPERANDGEAPTKELLYRDCLVARGRRQWMENASCEARGSFTESGFRLDQGGRVLVAQGALVLPAEGSGVAALLGSLSLELRARGAEPVALMDSVQLAAGSENQTDSGQAGALRGSIARHAEELGLEVCGGECGRSPAPQDTLVLVVVGVLPRVPRRDHESRGRVGDSVFRISLPEVSAESYAERILTLGQALRNAVDQEILSWFGSCRNGSLLAAADWLETTGLGLRLFAGRTDISSLLREAPGDFLVSARGETSLVEALPGEVTVGEVGAISGERLLDLPMPEGATLRLRPEEIRRDQKPPEFVLPQHGQPPVAEIFEDQEAALLELMTDFREVSPRGRASRGSASEGLPDLAGDVAVLRLGARRDLLALAVGSAQPFSSLDPYIGACLAVCRVTRGLAAAGAEPLGLLLTLPGEKEPGADLVYEGLRHAADALGTTIEMATAAGAGASVPAVVALGRPTATHLVPSGFRQDGHLAVLLGQTREEMGGSLHDVHFRGGSHGVPPWVDLGSERRLQDMVRKSGEAGLLQSALSLNAGGLMRGVLHACGVDEATGPLFGLRGQAEESLRPEAWLFGESPSRILASVASEDLPLFKERALRAEVPLRVIGEIGGDRLEIEGQLRLALESLRRAWHGSSDGAA
ncbi:MAG: AIR synthase related protein [Candidatus Binatia bacterium]|nr:AIR synthase related protein [Candidatus Binatia bacterium]MDG2010836.1 AIR synthase related protein [Candidatus Binatia bacterium]